jgi:hypothetical protein
VLDEPHGWLLVLGEISRLKVVRVYRLDDFTKQRAKSAGNLLQFAIEWVLVQVLIYVAHQVD